MNTSKITPLFCDTYLAVIKNSVGTNLFRNFYAKINGEKKDIMKNGELSCAFFVSSILVLFKLIKKFHGTVDGTIKDLEQSGWIKIKKPKIGSVLVWEAIKFRKNDVHKHIGVYVGNNKAISNNYELGKPTIHHLTFGKRRRKTIRKIEAIYWNKKLI